MLALATLTSMVAIALPSMAVSVLFDEIKADINLDIFQVGVIWGVGALPAIFSALFGGAVGDHFGTRRTLIVLCILIGLANASRALANDFAGLIITMSLFGMMTPLISSNTIKTCRIWFEGRQLGLANGIHSMGMALGFMLGSLISASWLSPMLGGWRNVFTLYGAITIILAVFWFLSKNKPADHPASGELTHNPGMGQAIAKIAGMKNIWLLGVACFGLSGAVQGMLGYLPLYLRALDWQPASADGAVATFHTLSMIMVLPLALLSDRLGKRKVVALICGVVTLLGITLLAVAQGNTLWLMIGMVGLVRDGFMAIFFTMLVEVDGVGSVYAGTATGFSMIFMGLGNFTAPALGNSLAEINPVYPFLLWGVYALIGIAGLLLYTEKKVIGSVAVKR